ncbi:zinc-binding dehydrogenase [Streptomyces sp. NPDC051554]|uniref:zinc-binding dehydrogenase n=1 Tax=Streptomyces sp. NPDC051554 TaxID=3365656 RepID=UPI00379ACAA3
MVRSRRAPERIGEYLAEALRMLAAGRIPPGVTQPLPLAEASKAHHLLETGTDRGKILLPPRLITCGPFGESGNRRITVRHVQEP